MRLCGLQEALLTSLDRMADYVGLWRRIFTSRGKTRVGVVPTSVTPMSDSRAQGLDTTIARDVT